MEETNNLISTFTLNEARFGIDSADVQEIVPCAAITPVHRAPAHIRGVINLRGQIFTVVDLAMRLGFIRQDDGLNGYIIIVAWQRENIGLLVDSVSDVVPVEPDALRPLPANVSEEQRAFIRGVVQIGAHPVAVLDVNAVLDSVG